MSKLSSWINDWIEYFKKKLAKAVEVPTIPTPKPDGDKPAQSDSDSTDKPQWVIPSSGRESQVMNPSNWPETIRIENVRFSGGSILWNVTKGADIRRSWPSITESDGDVLNAVLAFVVVRDGVRYLVVGEWLRPGDNSQDRRHTFQGIRDGKTIFDPRFEPQHGEEIGIVVMGLNWVGQLGAQERSNEARVVFP